VVIRIVSRCRLFSLYNSGTNLGGYWLLVPSAVVRTYQRNMQLMNLPAATAFAGVVGLLLLLPVTDSSYTTEVLRPAFEQTFRERCPVSKYPFIERYYRNIEQPSDRFMNFVFHEHGLKNGGFGDRIAGLISTAFIALRYNRTLLIQSGNGFDELFRPYHPQLRDYIDPVTKKTVVKYVNNNGSETVGANYANWTEWTTYNHQWEDNDATEYDLWNCINIAGAWTSTCSMDKGDASQPVVKIRGNRAYLCKWQVSGSRWLCEIAV
jgi:hypothetical protein